MIDRVEREAEMTLRKLLIILPVAQLVGVVGLMTGNPHGNPAGFIVAFVFLFPGGIASIFLLDWLGLEVGYINIILGSLLVNVVVWLPIAMQVHKWRRRRAKDASERSSLR